MRCHLIQLQNSEGAAIKSKPQGTVIGIIFTIMKMHSWCFIMVNDSAGIMN